MIVGRNRMNLRARCALSEILYSISVLSDEEKATVLRLAAGANELVLGVSADRLDSIVSKLIDNPNSRISRSLAKNVCAGRIRS